MRRLGLLVILVAVPVFAAKQRAVGHPTRASQAPTFSNEIVRIFQQNCQTCHREGDIAPFPLVTYMDAKPRASLIKFMTESRQMPPWKAEQGCREFSNERRLTDEQIATIGKWVDAGAPEGDRAQLPPPVDFAKNEWLLGQPDMIIANDVPYTPPDHVDTYRCFTVPTNLISAAYVRAIDTHPGDRTSVHHVIAYTDPTGASVALDEADPGPGYTCFGGPGFDNAGTLGGWGPGQRPLELPDGVAMQVQAQSRVVIQVHYHPHHGEPQPDQTQFGIYFSKTTDVKTMYVLPVINREFTIPPNDPHYRVDAAWPIVTPVPMKLWMIAPHMHLLGKSMRVEMTPLGGAPECLIDVEDWDFNWQGAYVYKQPVVIPAGSRVSLTAYYDNSENNPRNPNIPPKPVSWGEATTDEMCIAFLGFTIE